MQPNRLLRNTRGAFCLFSCNTPSVMITASNINQQVAFIHKSTPAEFADVVPLLQPARAAQ